MTVVKRYDSGTSQWVDIVFAREGDWSGGQDAFTETGDYTVQAGDVGRLLLVDSASDRTVTIPSVGWLVGQRMDVVRVGAGEVSVVGSGVTVDGTPGLRLRARFSVASLLCVGADRFVLVGDVKV